MPDGPTQDQIQERSPECPACGCDKAQFQRLRNFAKAVLTANADTLGTLACAKIALAGDLGAGLPTLVGRSRLHEPRQSAPAPTPIPAPKRK